MHCVWSLYYELSIINSVRMNIFIYSLIRRAKKWYDLGYFQFEFVKMYATNVEKTKFHQQKIRYLKNNVRKKGLVPQKVFPANFMQSELRFIGCENFLAFFFRSSLLCGRCICLYFQRLHMCANQPQVHRSWKFAWLSKKCGQLNVCSHKL